MQGNKPYLLCTQPLTQSLIDEAAGKGITVQCLSFTETMPIVDPALEKLVLSLSETSLTAVFTSVNAVDSVVQYLAGRKPFARDPSPDYLSRPILERTPSLRKGLRLPPLQAQSLLKGKLRRLYFSAESKEEMNCQRG
jgi:hypothetical protein